MATPSASRENFLAPNNKTFGSKSFPTPQNDQHQQPLEHGQGGNSLYGTTRMSPNSHSTYAKHLRPQQMEKGPTVTVNILVTAPDKDKVYRWLIGRNGTNIKLMQSTGVSIQVDRRLGNICLEGDPVLVDKVSQVINRLAADTASSSVGCGGKKVMTAIKRLIADCADYHSRNNANLGTNNGTGEVKRVPTEIRNMNNNNSGNFFYNVKQTTNNIGMEHVNNNRQSAQHFSRNNHLQIRANMQGAQMPRSMVSTTPIATSQNAIISTRNDANGRNNISNNIQNITELPPPGLDRVTKMLYVTAPDKDKVYRWLIGRNGTNIKLMQSTGVSIQVDRKAGTVLLDGETVLVRKVQTVIERLMEDTASPLVGCGGKKVMTAIKRLIADCAAVHAKKSGSFGTAAMKQRNPTSANDGKGNYSTNNYGNSMLHRNNQRSMPGSNTRNNNSYNNSQKNGIGAMSMRGGYGQQQFHKQGNSSGYKSKLQEQGQNHYVCNIEIAVSVNKREKAYSRLIGRGGNVIRRMERHSGAEIKVDKSQRNVFIQGKKDAVEKARMMVSSILTGVENDEFHDDLSFPFNSNNFNNDFQQRHETHYHNSQQNNGNRQSYRGRAAPGFANASSMKYANRDGSSSSRSFFNGKSATKYNNDVRNHFDSNMKGDATAGGQSSHRSNTTGSQNNQQIHQQQQLQQLLMQQQLQRQQLLSNFSGGNSNGSSNSNRNVNNVASNGNVRGRGDMLLSQHNQNVPRAAGSGLLPSNGWEIGNGGGNNTTNNTTNNAGNTFSNQITNEKSTPKDNNNWNSALFNFQTPLNRNSSNPSDVLNVGNGFNTLKSQPPSAPSTSINPLTSAFNSSSWEPIGNTNSQINSNNNDNNKPVSNFFFAQSSVTDNGGNGWDANANFSNRNSTNGNVNLKWT